MRRVHLFEIHDQSWYPSFLRDSGMAYLRFAAENFQIPAIQPVIEAALERSGEREILDLCSGGGGAIVASSRALREAERVRVTMTDFYPNEAERQRIQASGEDGLHYEQESVDATKIEGDRPGLRTVLNAFHHFRPAEAVQILASAVRNGRAIVVVEVLQRHIVNLVGMLTVPLIVLLMVPFLRPFRPAWIVFTYLVPVIPLVIMWDAIISSARCYSGEELLALAAEADPDGVFDWELREPRLSTTPIPGIALVGTPKASN